MNFSLIRQLVLKDVRHQRTLLLLLWLMAYLLPLTNFYQNPQMADLFMITKLGVLILLVLLILYIAVSNILLDPTRGSTRVLTTRPVTWKIIFASKALFAFLFLWLPIVIFRLGIVWTAGVHLSFPDQGFYVLETTLMAGAFSSFFVLPAFFFQRLPAVILTLIGTAILVFSISVLWPILCKTLDPDSLDPGFSNLYLYPNNEFSGDQALYLSCHISSFLLICAILGLTVLPVAFLRYGKSSLAIPLTLILGGYFLSLVYASCQPYSFDRLASDEIPAPNQLPASLRDQIHLTLNDPFWDISRTWDQNKENAQIRLESHFVQKVHIAGINRPLFMVATDRRGELTLASGRKLESNGGRFYPDFDRYSWAEDYLRQECCGMAPSDPNYQNSDVKLAFTFHGHGDEPKKPDISDLELPGASINGEVTFAVARFKILKMEPFHVGARLDQKRQCYEIRQIVAQGDSISYLLNRSSVPLLMRGDLDREEPVDVSSVPFIIINRRTGEILDDSDINDYFNPFDGLNVQWRKLEKRRPPGSLPNQPAPPIPGNWLNDAYICFYQIEPLGKITYPFSARSTKVIR